MQRAIGTNLTRYVQDICRYNYKTLLKGRKDVNPVQVNL